MLKIKNLYSDISGNKYKAVFFYLVIDVCISLR